MELSFPFNVILMNAGVFIPLMERKYMAQRSRLTKEPIFIVKVGKNNLIFFGKRRKPALSPIGQSTV